MKPEDNQSGPLTADEKNRLFMTLDANTVSTKNIERGMYGDPVNGVKGFHERLLDIEAKFEKRLTLLEDFVLKMKFKMTFISGVTALIVLEARTLWEWITNKHG